MKLGVLIVDNSRAAGEFLSHVIANDLRLEVRGLVQQGEAAVHLIPRLRPRVVCVDVSAYRSGWDTIRRIMAECPVPIVAVTSEAALLDPEAAARAGALALAEKPTDFGPDFPRQARHLCDQLVLMSGVSVIRQHRGGPSRHNGGGPNQYHVLALAAVMGRQHSLARVLKDIPLGFSVPILAVQPVATEGGAEKLAALLSAHCRLPVRVAQDGELPLPGYVYLTTERHHLVYAGARLRLLDCDFEQPSAARLFASLAQELPGACVGGVLAGWDDDGLAALIALRDGGGYTLLEDPGSDLACPRVAQAVKIAHEMRSLEGLGPRLLELFSGSRAGSGGPVRTRQDSSVPVW